MAVLGRVNFVGQQRVDLHHMLAMESFTAADFRAVITAFVGNDKTYIARGLEVVSKNGLAVGLSVANSLIFNPLDGNASFYIGLSDDPSTVITLPADQTNIFIEGRFTNVTKAPVNSGLWDPLSNTGEDSSGQEFSAAIDTQNIVQLEISVNTTGFTEGSVPLFRATTSASAVTDFTDSRNMLFRLGTGGSTPDPLHKYEWSGSRAESVPNGTGVGDSADSPWRSKDPAGSLNDKAFKSFKDWMDAVMTRISEIDGTSIWYQSPGGGTTGISVQQLFFDTIGHSIQPSKNAAFKWSTVSGDLKLTSEGIIPINGTTSEYHNGLIKWQANNTGLEWELGGTFSAAVFYGGKRNYTSAGLRFESPAVADGGNVYLYLEREVPKGSGSNVSWGDAGTSGFITTKSVSGDPGDFTGIAMGDYIRKESGSFNDYFRVIGMWDGATTLNNATDAHTNTIADDTIISLNLESVTDPVGTNIAATSEPLIFFRSRYSSADVVADTTADIYSYQHSSFYWLGRREGNLFILRDYGTMQEGEEVTTLDVTYAHGKNGGDGDLVIEHAKEAVYEENDGNNGYSLKTDATTDLITIHRRKRDNTLEVPGGGDNTDSLLEYNIVAPVGTMTVGQSLWVRLSDTTDGVLSAGSVTNTTDDEDNTDITTNTYEILDPADVPTRSLDNIDVFLLARRVDINGQPALIFLDGSILTEFGYMIPNNLDVSGEVRLNDYDDTAIPFIAEGGSKLLDQDSTNFFFNKTTQQMGMFNFRWENNRLFQDTPEDVSFLDNLGAHTLSIGTSESTTYFPGSVIVDGDTVGLVVDNVHSVDKLITLGVESPLNESYGGGIELSDDARTATQTEAFSGSPDVTITFTSLPAYSTGDIVIISAANDVGGITAGQISGQYTISAGAPATGEAQVVGSTLVVGTNGSATSNETDTSAPFPTVSKPEWSIRLGDSDGNHLNTGDITSWVFRVKGETTAPTLTPVTDYGIVPTAHSVNMAANRIPFTNNDNEGPLGVDSTLNFSANFTWNNNTNVFAVTGTTSHTGNINPGADDTYDLGEDSTPLRWRILHLGPGSDSGIRVGGTNLYEDGVDSESTPILKTDYIFEADEYIRTGRMTQYIETTSLTGPTPLPTGTDLNVFVRDGLVYSQDAGGYQKLLTNIPGNVYEENVTIVDPDTGTSNDNDHEPINVVNGYTVLIPLDTKALIGNTAVATTDGTTATVTVTVIGHGLITGDLITTLATSAIGGISASNLEVVDSAVTVIDPDTFTYIAGAVSTSADSGFLDKITAIKEREYIVGDCELEVFLNGVQQIRGVDYNEFGFPNTLSNQVTWLKDVPFESPLNIITYRISANGGKVVISQAGGGVSSLQDAYDGGPSITIVPGFPFTITNPGSGKAAVFNGDIDVTGVIDPTAITFTPQASDPVPATQSGIYIDSGASLDLIYVRDGLANINMVQDFLYRDGSKTMTGALDMNSNLISNVTNGVAAGDATNKGQLDAEVLAINNNITNNYFRHDGTVVMTGNIDANSNLINNLANGVAVGDAVNKSQLDAVANDLSTNYFRHDGTVAMTGNIDANSNRIINVPDVPVANTDAVNANYVNNLDRYTAVYIDLTNNTGAAVNPGDVVMLSQTVAGELELADATALSTSEGTIGVVVSTIGNTATGKVQILGRITVNTSSTLSLGKTVYLSETTGEASSTPPTNPETVVFILGWAISNTEVVLNPSFETININIYEERLEIVSGAPADDNEKTGPVTAGSSLSLPLDSRNSNAVRQYVVGSGQLQVEVNGVGLEPNEINETGAPGSLSSSFTLTEDLAVTDVVLIRIDASDSSFVLGGAGGSMQASYDGGQTILVSSGNPLTINGPVAEKLFVVNGDIEVTGLIDPAGLQLTPQASDPFQSGDDGLYVDISGNVIHSKNGGALVNLTAAAESASSPESLSTDVKNTTGGILSKGMFVYVDSNGEMNPVNISNDTSLTAIGILSENTNDEEFGRVTTHGRIKDVTLTAIVGDIVYAKPGGSGGLIGTSELTDGVITAGNNGFSIGDYGIRVGIVVKNIANPAQKDIIIDINPWSNKL